MAKLCMGCMNPLPDDTAACTVCGFDPAKDQNPAHCLPVTTSLQGHYIVGRMVGEYPDHLLYLAYDRQMKEPCFIQEFFPASIGRRDTIGGVQPLEGCDKAFEEYADGFRANLRVLARMRELPAIVPVYDIFEENGTVYAVSDYCEGMTLTKKIKLAGGRIPWAEARSIFMSLLGSLIQLSQAGVCHLAICPDNILIGSDGKPRLRNFSIAAAHHAGTDLVADLKTGYAAPEQYYADEELGVPADVYALAATIFRTVTGTEPPAGDNRAKNSDDLFMSAEVAEELTQPVCVALFNALQVLPERRTATLSQLRDELSVDPKVSALVDEAAEDMADPADVKAEEKSKRNGMLAMLIISLSLLLIAVVVIVLLLIKNISGGNKTTGTDSGDSTTTTRPTYTTQHAEEGEAVVDDMVGRTYEDVQNMTFAGDMTLQLMGYRWDAGWEEGVILEQYPPAGTAQAYGSPIYVVVNNSRVDSNLLVPDLKGWKKEHASEFLKALGFKVTERIYTQGEATFDRGLVELVEQAGKYKEAGDEITLWISNQDPAPEVEMIPNLETWDATYAQQTLELLGFEVQVVYNPDSSYEKGIVESVEGVGTEAPVGSVVVLNVSSKESTPAVDDTTDNTDDGVINDGSFGW